MINLGLEVQDIVTGFRGIATARVEYLNGCVQCCVEPKVGKDGIKKKYEYIDEVQLEAVGKGVSTLCGKRRSGGRQSNCPNY